MCRVSLVLWASAFFAALLASGDERSPDFSREFTDHVDVTQYLPTKIGTTWVFHHQYRTAIDADGRIGVIRWKLEQKIVADSVIREGRLIRLTRRAFDIEDDVPKETADTAREQLYRKISTEDLYWLIAGNYVYFLPSEALDDHHLLRSGVARRLESGEMTPDLFFPLGAVKLWAEEKREREEMDRALQFQKGEGPAPNPLMYFWHHMGIESVDTPAGRFSQAHHLKYFTIGGPSECWFVPKTGIVKSTYRHQGTYLEEDAVLVVFEDGK